jgi:DNA-binding MarR family transcriptional regulator
MLCDVTESAELTEPADAAKAVGKCPTEREFTLLRQWDALQSGFRRLTDQLLCEVGDCTGLTPSSFQVLWFLLTTPDQSAPMHQLAETLGFTTAGTTKVADRLAQAGLLERRPQPADRRVVLAALTQSGRQKAITAARTFAQALQQRIVEPLGEEHFTSLADAIRRLDPRGEGL